MGRLLSGVRREGCTSKAKISNVMENLDNGRRGKRIHFNKYMGPICTLCALASSDLDRRHFGDRRKDEC